MGLLTGLFAARDAAGNGTSPRGARRALGGLLARGGPGAAVRTGVLYDDGTPVVTGTGAWAVSIRPFTAVAKYTDANGPIVFANDSVVGSVAIDPAPGSGSRIDIIYALHPLVASDGGSGTSVAPIFGVAKSAASGAPTPPPIPSGAVELTRGTVSAGMASSADVVWSMPQWTVTNGGIIPTSTTGGLVWNGSSWARIGYGDGDWVSVPINQLWNFGSGVTAAFFRYKIRDDRVVVHGLFNKGANNWFVPGSMEYPLTAALPPEARPSRHVPLTVFGDGGKPAAASALSDGRIVAVAASILPNNTSSVHDLYVTGSWERR